jgi:hypothetical protein
MFDGGKVYKKPPTQKTIGSLMKNLGVERLKELGKERKKNGSITTN